MSQRNILIAGASGLVGREVVALLAKRHPESALHLLVRRPIVDLQSVGNIVQHIANFEQMDDVELPGLSAFYCCLGTTIKVAGSKTAFFRVDHDYVLSAARLAHAHGAKAAALVSAAGSSPRALLFYSRVKGETERDFIDIGFSSVVIVRPSFLAGERERLGQPVRSGEKLALQISQGRLGRFLPSALRAVKAEAVAAAMIDGIERAHAGVTIIESGQISPFA